MTMQSPNLLPALRALLTSESHQSMSFKEMIGGLVSTDRAMYAAEFASAVSFGMWYIFDGRTIEDINVPETIINVGETVQPVPEADVGIHKMIQLAYEKRWPGEFDQYPSVQDRHQLLLENGEDINWLQDGLKGQLAEFNAMRLREHAGHTEVTLAADANQQGWDYSSVTPGGEDSLTQVKTGDSHSYNDFQEHMTKYPNVDNYDVSPASYDNAVRAANSMQDGVDRTVTTIGSDSHLKELVDHGLDSVASDTDYPFRVGSQVYDMLADSSLLDQKIGIGSDYELVEGITDGLETLSDNQGIDIPNSVVDILPFAGAIMAGSRLVYSVLKTEGEFKAVSRTEKNKVQVVQTLTLMSRMGVSTVLSIVGGMGGTAVGSAVPVIGNVAGGISGAVIGAGTGMYLNKHLQPHILDLALDITGLTRDDLFYYKNKPRIDQVALSFQTRVRELAAAPVGF